MTNEIEAFLELNKVICPECKEEITRIKYEKRLISCEISELICTKDDMEIMEVNKEEKNEIDILSSEYRCPECNEVISNNRDVVENILTMTELENEIERRDNNG